MNKLVLLSEVRNGKNINKVESVQEDFNESYVTFKEKFQFSQNKKDFVDFKSKEIYHTKYEKRLNKIMKKVFLLNNKLFLREFINSIYNDDLSQNTTIEYMKNRDINVEVISLQNSSYNLTILAVDEYRKFEYQVQFETRDYENIAITISKMDLTNNCDNIISLNKKRRDYAKDNLDKRKENHKICLIMLNSNIEVPDVYEIKSNIEGQNIDNKVNVIKGWKYDFKQLFEKEMYLLFPMKVLDLRKRLLSINQEMESKDLIKDYIFRFFNEMNKYLKKIKDKNLITDDDINEINLITIDLLNNFIREKNNVFVDIKREIEAKLKGIVV